MHHENYSYLPKLAIIVVHLSAYYPPNHPDFHSKQFTNLLLDSIKYIQNNLVYR